MSKRRLSQPDFVRRELQKAIINNQACVNKLLKYESKGFSKKIPEQIISCANARKRLYNAWDAIRNTAET